MTDAPDLADSLHEILYKLDMSDSISEGLWKGRLLEIIRRERNVILAALRAAPAAEIPREPTQAMIDAAFVVYDGMRPGSFSAEMTRMWRAMHDAAINGPAACSSEVCGACYGAGDDGHGHICAKCGGKGGRPSTSAGSGAAPLEGLADAIERGAERVAQLVREQTAALSAELARVKGERDNERKRADDNWQECENLRVALAASTPAKGAK